MTIVAKSLALLILLPIAIGCDTQGSSSSNDAAQGVSIDNRQTVKKPVTSRDVPPADDQTLKYLVELDQALNAPE